MLLFDRREFRVWRWWEVLFDLVIAYAASMLAAGLLASGSSRVVAYWVFAEPYSYDFDWTNYVLIWVIQPCFFASFLVAMGIGRGYTGEVLWSPLPVWSWRPWSIVAAVSVAWYIVENLVLYLWFENDLVADTESFLYLFSTPLAGIVAIAAVVIAPVSEEFVFRRILLVPLARSRLGFPGAAILTSLLWASAHFYSWPQTAFVFLAGIAFCYLARWAGSIWPGTAAHALYNFCAVVGTLLYLQNSG